MSSQNEHTHTHGQNSGSKLFSSVVLVVFSVYFPHVITKLNSFFAESLRVRHPIIKRLKSQTFLLLWFKRQLRSSLQPSLAPSMGLYLPLLSIFILSLLSC